MDKSHKVSGADGRIWRYSCPILNVLETVRSEDDKHLLIPLLICRHQTEIIELLLQVIETGWQTI